MNSVIEARLRPYYSQKTLNQEIIKCHCGRPMRVYQMYIYPGWIKNPNTGEKFENNDMGCIKCYTEYWKEARTPKSASSDPSGD